MINPVKHSISYFQAPNNYFWQWADNAEVIEWSQGSTICYRDDLILVLKEFSGNGLPSLSTILLVLTACNSETNIQHKLVLLKTAAFFADKHLYGLLDKAIDFMRIVNALPAELKTGSSRITLIHEVFGESNFVFANRQIQEALDELNSGRLDSLVIEKGPPVTKEQFITDLSYLAKGLEKFHNAYTLELKLRTGLNQLPEAATVKLPDIPAPGLTEQLLDDPLTRGIAKLAAKLISVLNIPLHSNGSGEQPYGGISDITNRGNYDRLLLSELAQDDALLMARLVNNEALYFRREEPPDKPKRTRTILLDTTLKMWGVPRVFALSAALAFAHQSKHGEQIAAYTLGGEKYLEADLSSKEGVIQLLGTLEHSLHCGNALQAIVNDLPSSPQNEYVLFTDAGLLNSAAFHSFLQKIVESLSFIITVNRQGDLHFYECIKGRTRILNAAKIDLNEWLFDKPDSTILLKLQNADGPAFISVIPSPLLHPKIRLKGNAEKMSGRENTGAIAVNENQRLLLMTSKQKGAYEVVNYIEKGNYTFGWDEAHAYVLVNNTQSGLLKLYTVQLENQSVATHTLPEEIVLVRDISFNENHFYLRTNSNAFSFNCHTLLTEKRNQDGFNPQFHPAKINPATQLNLVIATKFIAKSIGYYSAMFKVKDVYICKEGKLVLGNYYLDLIANKQKIRIIENTVKRTGHRYSKEINNRVKFLGNKNIKFSVRVWDEGSEAIIDSRGFLHLKSADKNIPEITAVLISGANTACWASDGTVCGETYFTDGSKANIVSCEAFYKKYIQPFIDRLMYYEITTTA